MKNIAISCKSYQKDVLRARKLADSIDRYNCDGIPFYLSAPGGEISLFRKEWGQVLKYHFLRKEWGQVLKYHFL